jgi:hypothetical protein
MASKKTTNRRPFADVIVLALIGLCVVMIAIYQLQGAASVLTARPESTLTQTGRPSGGFAAPTRASEDFVGTPLPAPTNVVPKPTLVIPTPDAPPVVIEEDS